MDYYSILGISKNADDAAIRKAYKQKSMQYHPDRPDGDEEQFKKVNEAYSILKDPQKRGIYDHEQDAGHRSFNFNTGNMNDFDDMFSQMFRNSYSQPRTRNPDIRLRVSITLQDVLVGKEIILTYQLRNGEQSNVNLSIPPGAKSGDTVKFNELGESVVPGRRGDLYIIIEVENNKQWRRSDNDLYTSVKVNSLDLILGCSKKIELLTGRTVVLTVPPYTNNNTTFNVSGHGIPNIKTGKKGNLYVQIESQTPKNLSQDQLNKIKEVRNEID